MFRFATVLVVLFVSLACSHQPILRSDYALNAQGDIVYSNSPTFLLTQPVKAKEDGSIDLEYSVILQNTSKEISHKVYFKKASFTINDDSLTAICEGIPLSGDVIELPAGKKGTITCRITVVANEKNQMRQKDAVAYLKIPFDGGDEPLTFRYPFRIEDFEE
jgi:hypothetical protein